MLAESLSWPEQQLAAVGPNPSALALSGPAQPCRADPQDLGQGQGGAPKPTCLQEACCQLMQQGGKQYVRPVAAAAAAAVSAVKLPSEPLPVAAAYVWFWATVRRLALSLCVVAHVIEPYADTNAPWLGCWAHQLTEGGQFPCTQKEEKEKNGILASVTSPSGDVDGRLELQLHLSATCPVLLF